MKRNGMGPMHHESMQGIRMLLMRNVPIAVN